jgi:UBX domain-containing protein 7
MILTMCIVLLVGKTTIDEEDEELARAVAAFLEQSKEVPGESDATDDMAEPEEEDEPCTNIKLDYPLLPEEPTGSRDLLCRVAIRLPDGRRIQRNFLHTDPIKVTQPKSIPPGSLFRIL